MNARRAVLVFVLLVAVTFSLLGQEIAQEPRELDTLETALRVAPNVILNVVPGFGAGSYLQGRRQTGVTLTLLDVLGAGLVGGGLYGLSLYPEDSEDEGGWAALMLVSGYGVLLGSRVAGVASPILTAAREGVDPDGLLPVLFYNTLPGFGAGSTLQQDFRGAVIAGTLDVAAFAGLGVLSFVALAGMEVATTIAAVSMYGFYAAGRVYSIVRPIRFRREQLAAQ